MLSFLPTSVTTRVNVSPLDYNAAIRRTTSRTSASIPPPLRRAQPPSNTRVRTEDRQPSTRRTEFVASWLDRLERSVSRRLTARRAKRTTAWRSAVSTFSELIIEHNSRLLQLLSEPYASKTLSTLATTVALWPSGPNSATVAVFGDYSRRIR